MTATVEKLHATVDELEVSMENLAMEVAELYAQVSRLREEVSNADLICQEETATNEQAIKDVQDAEIEPDTGNSDSDGLLCEGWSGRLSYTTESCFPKPGPSKDLQQKSGGRY